MKFRVEHTFRGIDLASYETLYFDEPFNQQLCAAVNLDRNVLERDIKDGTLRRVVKVAADREIPGPVAKVVGANKIEYTEYVDYRMGSYEGTWKTVSSLLTDKIQSQGRFGFKEVNGGVQRWLEGEIKVKVFGLGGMVEKFIVSDVEKSYDHAAKFTQAHIDKQASA